MKILVPLYIYPIRDGQLAPEWQMMIDAQKAGVPVVAVANPGSGPGTEGDRPSYERGMKALRDCGVEVIGYVASGYGKTDEKEVKGHIDRYKEWYGEWVTGIFLDETAHVADDLNDGDKAMCARYRGYRFHMNVCFGDSALVVMNTGTIVTEATLTNAVGSDVVWNVLENNREYMEKKFGKVTWLSPEEKKKKRGFLGFGGVGIGGKNGAGTVVGTPPAAPDHVKERAAFMVHGAARLTDDEICHWVNQLQDGGWTHVYMTDKCFDPTSTNTALHNPWDALPTYWGDLVKAVGLANEKAEEGEKPNGAFCCYA